MIPAEDDLTEAEYEALRDAFGGDEEQETQFAVIYYRGRQPVVEGPFSRSLAERKADTRGGRIIERTKQTLYGPWIPADERFAEFDKAGEKD